jgi:hypothetical protein
MTKRVVDLLADVMSEAGVQRVYGVSGDSLKGITDLIRSRSGVEWSHVRHEEAAAFAAGAEAHLTGKLAFCTCSCAPGNLRAIGIEPNEKAAKISLTAYHEALSLREAALKLASLTAEPCESWVRIEEMTHPLRGKS